MYNVVLLYDMLYLGQFQSFGCSDFELLYLTVTCVLNWLNKIFVSNEIINLCTHTHYEDIVAVFWFIIEFS